MTTDVLVVGAGIAGLFAARRLQAGGATVTVLEREPAPGGRLATVRVGDATFDAGAQFFTARDPRFVAAVEDLRARGRATTWFHGAPDADPDPDDHHPRFRGLPDQQSLALALAGGLDVRYGVEVDGVAHRGTFRLHDTGGREWAGSRLLVTAPVPLALRLLSGIEVPAASRLRQVRFDPTLALLARPSEPRPLGERGALRLSEGPIAWVGDNEAKGVSATPALTVHADGETSRRWWRLPDGDAAARIAVAATELLGVEVEPLALRRWPWSRPRSVSDLPSPVSTHRPGPFALAGDGLTAGRVEGAAISGLDAAEALLTT